jgi:N-acetylglucosamine-6-phosphate deacetylase
MTLTLVNGRVLTPQGFRDDAAVVVEGGHISRVCAQTDAPADGERFDLDGGDLLPGFVDVQVNGGGGVLFNDDPSVEAIEAIAAAHRRFGTTALLPTLISDDFDTMARAIAAVRAAIQRGVPGVIGIHLEGPFLNAERKGVHDAAKFRTLDEAAFALLASLGVGRTLVTLAPEKTTPAMISRLAAAGVIVSAGHTNATHDETRAALDAGLTGFTHLFNAMSPLKSRAPGVVGAALEDQKSWCGLIVDGRHVDPAVLRIALRCKPLQRFMLVTDAMPSVGSKNKSFVLQGRTIKVENGVCIAPDGTLAGSDLDMGQAFRNAISLLGVKLEDAAAMASRNPACFLGDDTLGQIRDGARANLVLLTPDGRIAHTWIDGKGDAAG